VSEFTDVQRARALATMIAKFESLLFGEVRNHLELIARLDGILTGAQSSRRLDAHDYRRAFRLRRFFQQTMRPAQ
jgi:hypothetical protein